MSRARRPRRHFVILALVFLILFSVLTSSNGREHPKRFGIPFQFGAYVDPPVYTDTGRIKAFETFEKRLGRKLDLYHSYHPWDQEFPSEGDRHFAARGTTVLLSWAGTDTLDIASGQYDDLIRSRARGLRDVDNPVILQWRWEMNRPNLATQIHSPQDYVSAWRHLHDMFTQEGATNVQWAWCPLVDERADPDYSAYYPGDGYVDWIGANGYARTPSQSFEDVFDSFFEWAKDVRKPILIGEFGRSIDMGSPGSTGKWLDDARETILERPRIRAVAYFNSARGTSGNYDLSQVPGGLGALGGFENIS